MKRTVILGVTGSIAAYKAADVARELMRAGFDVRAVLTRSAQRFVTVDLFEGLTGNPCLADVFDEPQRGRMAHIDWARECAAIVVCPATANAIANMAHGNADDMLTTIISASSAPLVAAPAMNPEMYASQANQENLCILRSRGIQIVAPQEGDVACGEFGEGKLAAVQTIVQAVTEAAYSAELLNGVRVLVTAGPTHEAIDPVRFIGNRSSGRMGYAIAKAAKQMGASVTLISGPSNLTAPANIETVRVTSAQEMLDACISSGAGASLFIGAAAVADFSPEQKSEAKLRRSDGLELKLQPTKDIAAEMKLRFPEIRVIAFAAEMGEDSD